MTAAVEIDHSGEVVICLVAATAIRFEFLEFAEEVLVRCRHLYISRAIVLRGRGRFEIDDLRGAFVFTDFKLYKDERAVVVICNANRQVCLIACAATTRQYLSQKFISSEFRLRKTPEF